MDSYTDWCKGRVSSVPFLNLPPAFSGKNSFQKEKGKRKLLKGKISTPERKTSTQKKHIPADYQYPFHSRAKAVGTLHEPNVRGTRFQEVPSYAFYSPVHHKCASNENEKASQLSRWSQCVASFNINGKEITTDDRTTGKGGDVVIGMWTCCRSLDPNAPACQASPFGGFHTTEHSKCVQCGVFYSSKDGSPGLCSYHAAKEPIVLTGYGAVVWSCCNTYGLNRSKYMLDRHGSKGNRFGCVQGKHIPEYPLISGENMCTFCGKNNLKKSDFECRRHPGLFCPYRRIRRCTYQPTPNLECKAITPEKIVQKRLAPQYPHEPILEEPASTTQHMEPVLPSTRHCRQKVQLFEPEEPSFCPQSPVVEQPPCTFEPTKFLPPAARKAVEFFEQDDPSCPPQIHPFELNDPTLFDQVSPPLKVGFLDSCSIITRETVEVVLEHEPSCSPQLHTICIDPPNIIDSVKPLCSIKIEKVQLDDPPSCPQHPVFVQALVLEQYPHTLEPIQILPSAATQTVEFFEQDDPPYPPQVPFLSQPPYTIKALEPLPPVLMQKVEFLEPDDPPYSPHPPVIEQALVSEQYPHTLEPTKLLPPSACATQTVDFFEPDDPPFPPQLPFLDHPPFTITATEPLPLVVVQKIDLLELDDPPHPPHFSREPPPLMVGFLGPCSMIMRKTVKLVLEPDLSCIPQVPTNNPVYPPAAIESLEPLCSTKREKVHLFVEIDLPCPPTWSAACQSPSVIEAIEPALPIMRMIAALVLKKIPTESYPSIAFPFFSPLSLCTVAPCMSRPFASIPVHIPIQRNFSLPPNSKFDTLVSPTPAAVVPPIGIALASCVNRVQVWPPQLGLTHAMLIVDSLPFNRSQTRIQSWTTLFPEMDSKLWTESKNWLPTKKPSRQNKISNKSFPVCDFHCLRKVNPTRTVQVYNRKLRPVTINSAKHFAEVLKDLVLDREYAWGFRLISTTTFLPRSYTEAKLVLCEDVPCTGPSRSRMHLVPVNYHWQTPHSKAVKDIQLAITEKCGPLKFSPQSSTPFKTNISVCNHQTRCGKAFNSDVLIPPKPCLCTQTASMLNSQPK